MEDEKQIQECIEVIRAEQKASVSLLQRRLRLGYMRASAIMDELEKRGIVGPAKGAEPRDVFLEKAQVKDNEIVKTGMMLINEERARQISAEGYSSAHDDKHSNCELQRAAECYFLSGEMHATGFKSFRSPNTWPWEAQWWKPSDPIRDFTKAGALWLAEIDRLERLGKSFWYPTIMLNLKNRVAACARSIDVLNAASRTE